MRKYFLFLLIFTLLGTILYGRDFLYIAETDTVKWHYAERVPERIRYIEKDLAQKLGVKYIPDTQIYLMWTLIAKENDIGIYLYGKVGPHQVISHVFMYNGKKVFYTNINNSLGMRAFIKSNGFSEQKIKEFNEKLELFKKNNKEVHQRW